MMKFINNNIVIEVRFCSFCERAGVQCLNGNKQMVNIVGPATSNKHVTEVGILQHCPKSMETLPENLLPMCYKKQTTWLTGMIPAKASIIQSGNDRLSGTGGCDD